MLKAENGPDRTTPTPMAGPGLGTWQGRERGERDGDAGQVVENPPGTISVRYPGLCRGALYYPVESRSAKSDAHPWPWSRMGPCAGLVDSNSQ